MSTEGFCQLRKLNIYFIFSGILLFYIISASNAFATRLPEFQTYRLFDHQTFSSQELVQKGNRFIAFGFNPTKQSEIETWMKKAEILGLPVAEIAIIDPRYQGFKSQVEIFMRRNVWHKPFLSSLYASYTNAFHLKSTLGLKPEVTMGLMLFNSQGLLLWQTTASFNEVDYANLKQTLKFSPS